MLFDYSSSFNKSSTTGARYIEIIKSQFGVVSPDSRLQRPEYLGGGHSRLDVSQVAQTSNTNLDYKKWERDMRKSPSSRSYLKRRRGSQ
jgi:hypothetical protein